MVKRKVVPKPKPRVGVVSPTINEQLREFLMSDEGFIPIEEAIKEADKKWPSKHG